MVRVSVLEVGGVHAASDVASEAGNGEFEESELWGVDDAFADDSVSDGRGAAETFAEGFGDRRYNQNLWIGHLSWGAASLPR